MTTRTILSIAAAVAVIAIPISYAAAQADGKTGPELSQGGPARPAQPPQERPGLPPRPQPGPGSVQPGGGFQGGPPMMGGGGGTAMVADGGHLYIVSGNALFKVNKETLQVMGRAFLSPGFDRGTQPAGRIGGGTPPPDTDQD